MSGEWESWRGTGRPSPSRETKFSGATGDREKIIFPIQLTTSRIGNLTRLILLNSVRKHQIQPEYGEWAGWRGTGWPSPSRETKFLGPNGDREIFIFPVQVTTSRIGNLTRLILLSSESKHQIQPEYGKWAGWRGTGWPNPSRETKFSGRRERGQENVHFPCSGSWPRAEFASLSGWSYIYIVSKGVIENTRLRGSLPFLGACQLKNMSNFAPAKKKPCYSGHYSTQFILLVLIVVVI